MRAVAVFAISALMIGPGLAESVVERLGLKWLKVETDEIREIRIDDYRIRPLRRVVVGVAARSDVRADELPQLAARVRGQYPDAHSVTVIFLTGPEGRLVARFHHEIGKEPTFRRFGNHKMQQ